MRKNDLNLIEADPVRSPASAAPRAALPSEFRAQIIRLAQTLVKELPAGASRRVMFTGAGRGVGTSFTVQAVSDVASELGYAVGCMKLNESDTGPVLPPASRGTSQSAPETLELSPVSMFPKRSEQAAFDLLLLDAPPIAHSAVAMRYAPSVEGIVLVVAAGASMEGEIRSALETAATCGGTCLGMVLNRRPRRLFWRS